MTTFFATVPLGILFEVLRIVDSFSMFPCCRSDPLLISQRKYGVAVLAQMCRQSNWATVRIGQSLNSTSITLFHELGHMMSIRHYEGIINISIQNSSWPKI